MVVIHMRKFSFNKMISHLSIIFQETVGEEKTNLRSFILSLKQDYSDPEKR